jgi:hypothetical protein
MVPDRFDVMRPTIELQVPIDFVRPRSAKRSLARRAAGCRTVVRPWQSGRRNFRCRYTTASDSTDYDRLLISLFSGGSPYTKVRLHARRVSSKLNFRPELIGVRSGLRIPLPQIQQLSLWQTSSVEPRTERNLFDGPRSNGTSRYESSLALDSKITRISASSENPALLRKGSSTICGTRFPRRTSRTRRYSTNCTENPRLFENVSKSISRSKCMQFRLNREKKRASDDTFLPLL